MGIITVVLHTSGELGAPCPNSAQLGFTAHTADLITLQSRNHGIWPLLPQGAGS